MNCCLIARRQQLPTQPCTFFWLSDGLALDGVIRSDNRGSESLFPLYLRGEGDDGPTVWRANFEPRFIEQIGEQLALTWLALGRGDLRRSFGPDDLLAYIYALFHSPTYRERYADSLRGAFPRVLIPGSAKLFAELAGWGARLVELHTLRDVPLAIRPGPDRDNSVAGSLGSAAPLCDGCRAAPPTQSDIAAFRAGGYTVLRKWLQPPRRSTGDPQYRRMVAAIASTLQIMRCIDEAILAAGGFPGAFLPA